MVSESNSNNIWLSLERSISTLGMGVSDVGRNLERLSKEVHYLSIITKIHSALSELPSDSQVAIASKGDALLLAPRHDAFHFPRTADGEYVGYHPADSESMISLLREAAADGAQFFVLPATQFWWLDYYTGLISHLSSFRCPLENEACLIFDFQRPNDDPGLAERVRHRAPSQQGKEVSSRRSGLDRRIRRGLSMVKGLSQRLWGGFSQYALADLETVSQSEDEIAIVRATAAWELASWFAVAGDWSKVEDRLALVDRLDGEAGSSKRQLLLAVQSKLRLGKTDEARRLLDSAVPVFGRDTDVCLAGQNILMHEASASRYGTTNDHARLAHINYTYIDHGLLPLHKIDYGLPLDLKNISCGRASDFAKDQHQKISVIVPAHNASSTIACALTSILEQTWQNLEIIVVDDASTDSTREIVLEFAERDSRIRLIALQENRGTYPARNVGVEHATGDLITTHDADDWAHAQKLERQVCYLAQHAAAVASVSYWVRSSSDLEFYGYWKPSETMVHMNTSSLMLRREIFEEIGGWDNVRIDGDIEFMHRVLARYGADAIAHIDTDLPLSFGLHHETSLTQASKTHSRSIFFGLRHTYRWASSRWHRRQARSGDLFLEPSGIAPRPFLAPRPMLSSQGGSNYDLILAWDFGRQGGTLSGASTYLKAAVKAGLHVGVFHWPWYKKYARLDAHAENDLYDFLDANRIDVIVPGQEATTKDLVMYWPPAFQFRLDEPPCITYSRLHVVVNQLVFQMDNDETRPEYDINVVKANLRNSFGSWGEWFPISGRVREVMRGDRRYPAPGSETWIELLDTDEWCQRELVWRGAYSRPVIGRHGRDHWTKWPSSAGSIEEAYCTDRNWETHFLGGADVPISILGYQPGNWQVQPFNSVDVKTFLADLDFLIHFPHENYIEEFGRVVMEALAVGVPVVLPRSFASTFGDAATYCQSGEVASTIEEMWSDRQLYLDAAEKGRQWVLDNCRLDELPKRLR